MSFLKSAFSFKKTKPRKNVSRSPLKLPADELYRELGPKCEIIDVRVADQKIVFDIENGDWNTGIKTFIYEQKQKKNFYLAGAESLGGTISSSSAQKIRKQVDILQEENNMLKLKVEVLLNLVAESIAELSTVQR
jgi:hypothetical protein